MKSHSDKNKKQPKLRFPGFTGEWEEKTFLELSENGFSNGVFNDPKMVGSGYKLINVKEMYEGDVINYKNLTLVNIPKNEFEKNKVLKGDIFFTRSSLVKDGIAFSNIFIDDFEDVTYDGHLIRMRPNKKLIESKYFSYQLKTPEIRRQLVVRGKTTTMTTIGQDDIATVEVNIPTLPEQKRIAEFLSYIDTKIEKLSRKKDLMSEYKKGVMQKIFSQNIRFKDDNGKNYPDWEEKRLGDVADLTSSKRVYLSDYVNEGIPFYRGKEITELKNNIKPAEVLYISKEAYNKFKEQFGAPRKNDILITAVGTLGNIYRVRDDEEFYFKDGNLIWLKNIKTDSTFLEILLESSIAEITKSSIGSTQRALTIIALKKLSLLLPCLEEQKKISDFLVDLDTRIQHIDKELVTLKEFKKGLLQGMFV